MDGLLLDVGECIIILVLFIGNTNLQFLKVYSSPSKLYLISTVSFPQNILPASLS